MMEEKKITVEYLTEYAEQFLADNYGFTLAIPIEINNRLRSTLGAYAVRMSTEEPVRIELAGYLIEYGAREAILDTLQHELIHYAVHALGKDRRDGADDFESELRKHGVSGTNTNWAGYYYITKCDACGEVSEIKTKRHITHADEYVTKCCRANYAHIGDVIYDGINRKEVAHK